MNGDKGMCVLCLLPCLSSCALSVPSPYPHFIPVSLDEVGNKFARRILGRPYGVSMGNDSRVWRVVANCPRRKGDGWRFGDECFLF